MQLLIFDGESPQVDELELLSLKRTSLVITAAINTLGLAPEQLLSSLEINQVASHASVGSIEDVVCIGNDGC